MTIKTVGERLSWLRYVSSLTQAEVGELAELSHACVGHIENEIRRPLAETLARVASVFGCSLDWLASGIGPAPSPTAVRAAVAAAARQRDAVAVARQRRGIA